VLTFFCGTGLYVKFGQGIASMNHILPPQYYKHLRVLMDQAPSVGFGEVEKIFRVPLGAHPDELFPLGFERAPVASASIAQASYSSRCLVLTRTIAQVHRATMADGTRVAVKVQKPYIQTQMPWDLFVYETVGLGE
jgi:aarF domain-containing kinase